MKETIRVGVYGASGYAGQELILLLRRHPQVTLVFATSNRFAGDAVSGTELHYIPMGTAPLHDVDAVFLALPHKASAPVAKQALEAGVRVLDLSADLRLDDPAAYERWYDVPHPHPELLSAPYGLPEIHRDAIPGAQAVAVPGCYPTTTLLGLYPLLKSNALAVDAPIIVDAKSGVSGAGRLPTATTHFVENYGNVIPYKAGRSHRHVGEIEQEILRWMPLAGALIFTPHLVPVDRGLMASIYVTLQEPTSDDVLYGCYSSTYLNEPLVNVLPLGEQARLKSVVHTSRCEISVTPINNRQVHITSVTDNLRKGAASQALQCFNVLYTLPETTALI